MSVILNVGIIIGAIILTIFVVIKWKQIKKAEEDWFKYSGTDIDYGGKDGI